MEFPISPQTLLILACCAALASFHNTQAATFYVSTSGDNKNPGTFASPWATPGYGSKHIQGGDTLFIMYGVYDLSIFDDDIITPPSGSAGSWTVIKGQGASPPILRGSGSLHSAIMVGERAYIHIEYLEITSAIDSPYSGGLRGGIDVLGSDVDAPVHYITIKNVIIHHIEEGAINLPGNGDHLVIQNCSLHHTGGTLIGSAHYNSGNGLEYLTVDSCYLGYGGHFYQGIEQQSPWDRPDGFGIEISEGPVEIMHTYCEHNYGDGLDSKSKRTFIHNCRVENNFADGVKLWGDSTRLENTLIYGVGDGDPQTTPWALLVVEIDQPGAHIEITNVTMHDGSPRGHYAATFQYGLSNPCSILMRNCIVQCNGTQLYVENGVTFTAQHNLFYISGSATQVEANGTAYDASGLSALGIGNLYGPPQFISPAWGTNGDYHVSSSSPAVDAGMAGAGIPAYDLDLYPRPYGAAYDIGCYEYHSPTRIESTETSTLDIQPTLEIFPLPFNNLTSVHYTLPESGYVQLTVCDVLGRTVRTLEHEYKPAGSYTLPPGLEGQSAGILFVILTVNGHAYVQSVPVAE